MTVKYTQTVWFVLRVVLQRFSWVSFQKVTVCGVCAEPLHLPNQLRSDPR